MDMYWQQRTEKRLLTLCFTGIRKRLDATSICLIFRHGSEKQAICLPIVRGNLLSESANGSHGARSFKDSLQMNEQDLVDPTESKLHTGHTNDRSPRGQEANRGHEWRASARLLLMDLGKSPFLAMARRRTEPTVRDQG
jgi:hypothetical protein